jgi:LacI family transcriptional regulator
VTIVDVARISNVSPATVTRALQGHPRVLPETRLRVEQAAQKLGYRPDSIAQALATGATNTIGLLVPSSGDTFWGEVAAGVEAEAAERGISVLFANGHGDPERQRQMLDVFLRKRVDAVIVAAAAGRPHEWLARERTELPVVLIAWDAAVDAEEFARAQTAPLERAIASVTTLELPGPHYAHIAFDAMDDGSLAAQHLSALGHERIAFIAGKPQQSSLLRLLGFRTALERASLRPGPIVTCEESLEGGRQAALELLRSHSARPTAIVAYNDLLAIGAIRAAHALGIRVPEDLSVVGCDDIDFAAFVEPPLTTVAQPRQKVGRLAIRLIYEQEPDREKAVRLLEAGTLVVRESTASVPKGGGAEAGR